MEGLEKSLVPEALHTSSGQILLEAKNLCLKFKHADQMICALDGVNFKLRAGEIYALVGESGSGKSTLARCLCNLLLPDSGEIKLHDLTYGHKKLSSAQRDQLCTLIQPLLQEGALDPALTLRQALAEPLQARRMTSPEINQQLLKLCDTVSLNRDLMELNCADLSGGQRQRAALARALSFNPRLLIADELTAPLDLSVQAQLINLLLQRCRKSGLTILLITHDFNLAAFAADRIGVMSKGKIVEEGAAEELCSRPKHPYTRALLHATLPASPSMARQRILSGLNEDLMLN